MEDKDLRSWTCSLLKAFLSDRGLKPSRRKAELILRVLEAQENGVPTFER